MYRYKNGKESIIKKHIRDRKVLIIDCQKADHCHGILERNEKIQKA
jgi:hypothetical protein